MNPRSKVIVTIHVPTSSLGFVTSVLASAAAKAPLLGASLIWTLCPSKDE
jgi:hypothetical protein